MRVRCFKEGGREGGREGGTVGLSFLGVQELKGKLSVRRTPARAYFSRKVGGRE